MKRSLLLAAVLAGTVVSAQPVAADTNTSQLDFAACPKVPQTVDTTPPANPTTFGCGPIVRSDNSLQGTVIQTGPLQCAFVEPARNTQLGALSAGDNPIGLFVHINKRITGPQPEGATDRCIGPGVGFGANNLTITVTSASGLSFTRHASTAPGSLVVFPLHGPLPPGTYTIKVDFSGGMTKDSFDITQDWTSVSATGTLVVTR